MEAYLDIETSFQGDITIVGVYVPQRGTIQLIGEEVTPYFVERILEGAENIYTYNGSRFDLPVIQENLELDLATKFSCCDLMYECWRRGLYGGLKKVEESLQIPRITRGINGIIAMRLWWEFETYGNREALYRLLLYNREDVENLAILRQKLQEIPVFSPGNSPSRKYRLSIPPSKDIFLP